MRGSHRFVLSFVAGLVIVAAGCQAGPSSARFAPDTFREHVAYLADDKLEGRGLGSDGIDLAAEYIAGQFASAGVSPAGDDGTYFQHFEATLGRELEPATRLAVTGVEGAAALAMNSDYAPLPFSGVGDVAGPVVFVGYGISAPEFNYDDYADVDVTGKVLLVLRFEPHDENTEAKFGGGIYSSHAYYRTKATLAAARGAKAMLFVNPPLHREDADTLAAFDSGSARESYSVPIIQITQSLADRMLAAGGQPDLKTLQARIEKERTGMAAPLIGVAVEGAVAIKRIRTDARNVVGVIKGTGSQADEYVVIGAHYDHLGNARYSLPRNEQERDDSKTYIHNGADDNASGTAGLIELARALAVNPSARSVLLIAFSGEESGLLGSEYFVANPTVPLASMVAMLNMDMIGMLREEHLTVFGVGTAEGFPELVRTVTTSHALRLTADDGGVGPSDHTPFYSNGIPVLHFFTGSHDRYHRPEDDTPHINAEGGARVVSTVHDIAVTLASAESRPAFTKVAEKPVARGGLKVRLGVMPSYADDDEAGMRITGVSGGGPAEVAGLRAGDSILMIGETPVNNVYDYMGALARYNPGATVMLTVRRDGERLLIPVTFGAAR